MSSAAILLTSLPGCFWWSCLLSFFWFLNSFSVFLSLFMISTLLMHWSDVSYTSPQFGLSDVCPWLDRGWGVGENFPAEGCLSHCIISGSPQCQCVLPVVLASITRWRESLPGSSGSSSYYLSFSIFCRLGESHKVHPHFGHLRLP